MPLTTLAQIEAAPKQTITFLGAASANNGWGSMFAAASVPSGGTLAGGRSGTTVDTDTAGHVPTSATPGYPAIAPFPAAATGYISGVSISLPGINLVQVASRVRFALFDRLYVAGPFSNAANVQMVSPPSYATRVPINPATSQPDYTSIEAWAEGVVASTGNLDVTIRYTNEVGTTGVQSPAQGIFGTVGVRRCFALPYAAGSKGIQALDRVNGGTATAGQFNVMILRRLLTVEINAFKSTDIVLGPHQTGCPIIRQDAALYPMILCDAVTATFEAQVEIAMG